MSVLLRLILGGANGILFSSCGLLTVTWSSFCGMSHNLKSVVDNRWLSVISSTSVAPPPYAPNKDKRYRWCPLSQNVYLTTQRDESLVRWLDVAWAGSDLPLQANSVVSSVDNDVSCLK